MLLRTLAVLVLSVCNPPSLNVPTLAPPFCPPPAVLDLGCYGQVASGYAAATGAVEDEYADAALDLCMSANALLDALWSAYLAGTLTRAEYDLGVEAICDRLEKGLAAEHAESQAEINQEHLDAVLAAAGCCVVGW